MSRNKWKTIAVSSAAIPIISCITLVILGQKCWPYFLIPSVIFSLVLIRDWIERRRDKVATANKEDHNTLYK